jgi:hypothetical protein
MGLEERHSSFSLNASGQQVWFRQPEFALLGAD